MKQDGVYIKLNCVLEKKEDAVFKEKQKDILDKNRTVV
jgi:hypothetical protein